MRLSQEWQASTTQRRARQPGVRAFQFDFVAAAADVRREAAAGGELVDPRVGVAAVETETLRTLG